MQVGVLTNSNSRKNQGLAARPEALRALVGDHGLVRQTRSLEEIRPVIEEFIDRGVQYWISDGGDGTLHWMINEGREVLEARGLWNGDQPLPRVVPTNGGTIDFVAKKAGIRGGADRVITELVQSIRSGTDYPCVEMDSIEVLGHRPGDPPGTMPFRKLGFAIAAGGLGQKFFSKYYDDPKPGPWAIIRVSLKTMFGHLSTLGPLGRLPIAPTWLRDYSRAILAGTRANVSADGKTFPYELYQGLHAASVDIDFGTMKLFPYATQPRKLHLVVGEVPPEEAIYKWVYLVMGKPVPGDKWHEFAGECMDIEARGSDLLDPIIDGELFRGFDKLRVQVGPRVTMPTMLRR